ncbi:YidH family protein [Allopontixanthobacter sediminis]|uniref:DUF202 domain-containing protein n=1 Tax=Allopontixanthobacter sediminis TaxID=1689985 RepID=A0A845B5P5_9SPHN|nr:DUF202 domain-containing protein [Allopontixanthobacter sediminis]MXP44757.1 DUF202 domain-containing protein [Allopontixanthobacter sediminis]
MSDSRKDPDPSDDHDRGEADRSTPNNKNEELADHRTDWAEDRTILALERTFAGWMRTAFAAIGIGLGFRALFGELEPPWLARAIATLFIALAIVLAISAERRTCRAFARLSAHAVDTPDLPKLRWLAYSVSIGAAVLIAALWVLR